MERQRMHTSELTVTPIGYVKRPSQQSKKVDVLRRDVVEIVVNADLAAGLEGIEGYPKLVLIFYCHQTAGFPLHVRPHRDPHGGRRGVFASRSPARPNPLGLTVVSLLRRQGNILYVQGLDALDGTPILDIKPFDTTFDTGEEPER